MTTSWTPIFGAAALSVCLGCSLVYDPDKLPATASASDASPPASDGGISDGSTPGSDAGTIDPTGWSYTPSNVGLGGLPAPAPAVVIDCSTTIDTSVPQFTQWCVESANAPPLAIRALIGGDEVAVLVVDSLVIAEQGTLAVVGSRPLVVIADGEIVVAGNLDADADHQVPGAGGNPAACTGLAPGSVIGRGGDGAHTETAGDGGGGGGGGGGYGSDGRRGGEGDENSDGGALGLELTPADALEPLRGGCPGGGGGTTAGVDGARAPGGGGGGAIQLSARTTLTVTGQLTAGGGGGRASTTASGGGGGGGSGGAILLEADELAVTGVLTANGGGGGAGQDDPLDVAEDGSNAMASTSPAPGGMGPARGGRGASSSALPNSGQPGGANEGGGGGGGGLGRVHLEAVTSCSRSGTSSGEFSGDC